jgi:hypothetical protein
MDFLGSLNVPGMSVVNPDMFDQTVVAAFKHLNDEIIELTMKEAVG